MLVLYRYLDSGLSEIISYTLDKTTINDGGYISFWFKLADEVPDKSNCVLGSSGCSGIIE